MRNSSYESALNRSGVKWEYIEEILLEDINREKGKRNQARLLAPLDPELVEQYTERARAGDQFPPVVLWRPGPRSLYIPIDGNNRLEAYEKVNKKTFTDAYVVESTDQKVIDFMTWTFNNQVNGKRLSPEENMEHAVTLVRMHGYSVTDVAKECGVKRWQVDQRVRLAKCKEVLGAHNVPRYKDLPDATLDKLGTLIGAGEDIFVEAVKAAGSVAMNAEDVGELIAEVKAGRTHADKLRKIQEAVSTPEAELAKAETRGGQLRKPKPTAREQLETLLKQAMRLLESQPDDEVLKPIGRAQQNQVQTVAGAVVSRLSRIFKLS